MDLQWQHACKLLKQRGEYILNNSLYSDCSFTVGNGAHRATFYCHRLILAMASSEFERMYFENPADGNNHLMIPNVNPYAFGHMLTYIYTDELHLETIEEAFDVYTVARKYMMSYLIAECDRYIYAHVQPDNVLKCYECAKFHLRHMLEDFCLMKIIHDTANILQFPSFLKIKFSTLLMILDQNYLNIGCELFLFDALFRYGIANNMIPNNRMLYNRILHQKQQQRPGQHIQQQQTPPTNQPNQQEQQQQSQSNTQQPNQIEAVQQGQINRQRNVSVNIPMNSPLQYFYQKRYEKWHQALKKIRMLTMTPEEFAYGPAKANIYISSDLLTVLVFLLCQDVDINKIPPSICRSTVRRYIEPNC